MYNCKKKLKQILIIYLPKAVSIMAKICIYIILCPFHLSIVKNSLQNKFKIIFDNFND